MKLAVPILLTANFFGLALSCTQYSIGYVSTKDACEIDGDTYRNHCRDLSYAYVQYSNQHDGRLGQDVTQDVSCDPCMGDKQRCYCTLSFWRFREWLGTDIPAIPNKNWETDPNNPVRRIVPFQTVKCD